MILGINPQPKERGPSMKWGAYSTVYILKQFLSQNHPSGVFSFRAETQVGGKSNKQR